MYKNNKLKIILLCVFFVPVTFNIAFLLLKSANSEDGAADNNVPEVNYQPVSAAYTGQEAETQGINPGIFPEFTGVGETEDTAYNTEKLKVPLKTGRVYQEIFDSLKARYNNNDIIGILKIPGASVFYPVAQHGDNDFYLEHDYFKRPSSAGSVFLDYENSAERRDPSTILFAHNMDSYIMFSHIKSFNDENFFNENRYVIFNTVYENNVWETFAFFETHISFNYIKVNFRSEQDFLKLAREITERSNYDTGIQIKSGDRILILSTCTNTDPDTRYVLAARMIKNLEHIPEAVFEQMETAVEDYLGG